jgi:hypothetical protein
LCRFGYKWFNIFWAIKILSRTLQRFHKLDWRFKRDIDVAKRGEQTFTLKIKVEVIKRTKAFE